MQEFESISASSYDPSALATKLTAKAAEGWKVVAIVPTGGDVTAFMTREKGGEDDAAKADDDDDRAAGETKPDTKPADTAITTAVETIDAIGESKPDDDEPASPSLVLPAKSGPASDPKPETATEPAGWAVAPEPATTSSSPTTLEPTGVQPAVTIQPATTYEPATSPGYQPAPAPTPASATPTAAASPSTAAPVSATPEPVAPAAAAPAVPAGWYADPAGRFELRYWDGSTWTEHVSRTGQQFTDPPVA